MEKDISFERAMELIKAHVLPLGCENIKICDGINRVVAQDIIAPINQPPFDRSPLDGYAICSQDIVGASHESPAHLKIVDTVYAGGWSNVKINNGEAVRIMTGAPIPMGADCVVAQEETDMGDEMVSVFVSLPHHKNICFCGEDFSKGDVLIPAGTLLNGAAMGVLASAGLYNQENCLTVYRTAQVAIICTGDELVGSEISPLPRGKIYSCNQQFLTVRLKELGMKVENQSFQFEDDADAVAKAIEKSMETADIVITTGGVSVGVRDIFHQVLPILGAERIFAGVALKPGSPIMFSLYNGKPILSLSGNPFAAAATFELFGRSLLACATANEALEPLKICAVLESEFPKPSKVTRFVRATLKDGKITLPQGHSSGQMKSFVASNCLAQFPAGSRPMKSGEVVTAYIL